MNKVISFFKKIQLQRVLVVFLSGLLLVISTACANPAQAKVPSGEPAPYSDRTNGIPTPKASGEAGSYNNRVSEQTELYDPIQERKGGMNNFSDVDPRVNTKGVDTKATGLVRNAQENIQKVQDPGEFAEEYREGTPFGERVKNIVDRVTDATQNTAEDASKGARRGSENLKDNADTAGNEFSKGARQGAPQGVEKAADSLNRNRT